MGDLQRVMYVDDDPDLLELVELSLSRLGDLEVETCDSGQAAVAATPRFRPQLVLLDLNMPELDGPSTAQCIRAVDGFASVPVVFITAELSASERALLLRSGAAGILRKPLDPRALAGQLRKIWQTGRFG